MAVPDTRRLVLVSSTGSGGQASHNGTGYFITGNLVLTASHVVPEDAERVRVRVESGEPRWREAAPQAVWRDINYDAVLIRVEPGLEGIERVRWAEIPEKGKVEWESTGYPHAAVLESEGQPTWTTAGLSGRLDVQGGGGQGLRELDLTVDSGATPTGWSGISGAPVFVGEGLAGIVKQAPVEFEGRRLRGVPISELLRIPAFLLAIATPWLTWPGEGLWALVLLAESGPGSLDSLISGAIENFNSATRPESVGELAAEPVVVTITDVLQSPERWLQFIGALCAAPVMIADVTGFEPGVMMMLGIRAAVRRGVTVPVTALPLNESHLSSFPFNIQETKVISYGEEHDADDPRHPLHVITKALACGLLELRSLPRYLDLPAYDAVRCPPPVAMESTLDPRSTILILCSFEGEYEATRLKISSHIRVKYPTRKIVRMLDVHSPRLVGQALYEHIRWAVTCLVDWTRWRGNVFFELGVRLACSDIGPVCVIDKDAAEEAGQKAQLRRLFGPFPYDRSKPASGLDIAWANHEAIRRGSPEPVPDTVLTHDATYRLILEKFDWHQEDAAVPPHELMRASAEAAAGKDPQAVGGWPVLFSDNPDFARELRWSVQERWISAWYYLKNRHGDKLKADEKLQAEVKRLANRVLLWIPKDTEDPDLKRLRSELVREIYGV